MCALGLIGMTFLSYPDSALAAILVLGMAIPTIYFIHKYAEEKIFLSNVFMIALLLRLALGAVIEVFKLRDVFGPDALTYDGIGQRLTEIWMGYNVPNDFFTYVARSPGSSGWGMNYLVGGLYFVFGRSMYIAQSFCAVIGAMTAPLIYICAENIFNNKRVSRLSALFIAIFPSFVIWSAQLMKDGLIIFLLVCAMTAILRLRKKFDYLSIGLLIFALFGIFSLRFYIFYMVAVSVVGSFVIGLSTSMQSIVRNSIIILVLGLTMTYLGVIRNANSDFEKYGNLERIQISRADLARSADSGFGADVDVSTPAGAIAAVPIGFLYLMFAPFPWQVKKISQIMVLPETFVWWMMMPVMLGGLWYTIRHRLRGAIPILLFSLMLTLSYSIFQGNVGMLYRQRTQLQAFLFIFIAVGWTVFKEKRENKYLVRQTRKNQMIEKLRARQVRA